MAEAVESVGTVRATGGKGQATVNLSSNAGIASAGGDGGIGRIRTDSFGGAQLRVDAAVEGTDERATLRALTDGQLVARCR